MSGSGFVVVGSSSISYPFSVTSFLLKNHHHHHHHLHHHHHHDVVVVLLLLHRDITSSVVDWALKIYYLFAS